MSREGEYRQLADDMFRRAANEQNAQLEAQWKILGVKYVAIAEQSPEADERNTFYDPVQSELLKPD